MIDKIDFNSIPFTDNFMFQTVMREKDICKEVIELLLGKKLRNVTYPENERSFSSGMGTRSVRFDVYVEDEDGNSIDIEMQNVDHGDLPERSRYYQNMLDASRLDRGDGYRKMKRSCIIFLCRFNPFDGKGRIYEFEMRTKDGYDLQDGAIRIFACTQGEKGDAPVEILQFLSYLKDKKPTNGLTRKIEDRVNAQRENAKWRKTYMENHWEEWRLLDEGEAKGIQKGRALEKAEAKKAFSQEMERIRRLSQLLREKGEIDLAFAVYHDERLREKLFEQYDIR